MTITELKKLLNQHESPVILLEGRRSMPDDFKINAKLLGQWLADNFPHARFRSGNAYGSDQAFSSGVILSDPTRLEIFAPTARHRAKDRHPDVTYLSPADLTEEEEQNLADLTNQATPKNASLINKRNDYAKLKSKANYLIRDTLKAIGSTRLGYEKPTLALFYVDLEKPTAGGTGHTIRVCQQHNISTLTQEHWLPWISEPQA